MVTLCGGGGAWLEAEGFCELVTLSVLRDSASCGDEEDSTVNTQREINTYKQMGGTKMALKTELTLTAVTLQSGSTGGPGSLCLTDPALWGGAGGGGVAPPLSDSAPLFGAEGPGGPSGLSSCESVYR